MLVTVLWLKWGRDDLIGFYLLLFSDKMASRGQQTDSSTFVLAGHIFLIHLSHCKSFANHMLANGHAPLRDAAGCQLILAVAPSWFDASLEV